MGGGGDYLRDPLQLGLSIVGVTAMFGGAGWWLDNQFGTFPFLMVFGAVAGMFGILYITVMRLRESERKRNDPSDRRP